MDETKRWLTIIIPAYNAERYLRSCISSLSPSTHGNIEVVVVDDGSTDSTAYICDLLAQEYDNVTAVHKPNGGVQSARNLGFSYADTEWVWFVDSDDLIAPQALETLEPMLKETEADALHLRLVEFARSAQPCWSKDVTGRKPRLVSTEEFIRGLYKGVYEHYFGTFLFRARALRSGYQSCLSSRQDCRSAVPFREEFSLYEDVVEIESFMRRTGRVLVVDLNLYGFRQVPSSATHRASNRSADGGLRAVMALEGFKVEPGLVRDKLLMEITLLFSAYRLVEEGRQSNELRRAIRVQIESRVARVGVSQLGLSRLLRYALMRVGILDAIVSIRSGHENGR